VDTKLREKVNLMANNYHELKRGFMWEPDLLRHFGAMIHAIRGEVVNINALQEIKEYVRSQSSWASYFRGNNTFIISNLLYFEKDYRDFFRNMQLAYEEMKEDGFRRSTYLPLAAYTIVKETPKEDYQHKIKRMYDFYNKMKENHYWLTSQDDYVFAAVLATTDLNVYETSNRIEECYKYLNNQGFYKGNELQTLSHILAIGEEGVEEKCRKAVRLSQRLKEEGCKLQYQGLASLGVLTLVTDDVEKIVRDVKEVYDYLYITDGYGFWKMSKYIRVILAANLVSDYYVDEIKKGVLQVALGNSINAIIIAQQQAAVAAACAASTAAASSASS
jgi:hypothetical protein